MAHVIRFELPLKKALIYKSLTKPVESETLETKWLLNGAAINWKDKNGRTYIEHDL